MTDPPKGEVAPTHTDVDASRRSRMARILAWGSGGALVLAVLVGVAGGTGRASAAVLLLVVALASALAAAYGLGTSVLDEYRGEPISRRRIAWMLGLFVATVVLMAMIAGIGG